jgi:hypothetical protein
MKKVLLAISIFLIIFVVSCNGLSTDNNNSYIPLIDNENEVVYEKVDENGDVVYTITKQELYEEMKRNNGINQLLTLIDEKLLESYLNDITQEEIDEKIELLKYQTNDQDVIAEYDQDILDDLEENFRRSMILSGYQDDQEEDYAKLLIARENFVMDEIIENGDITENDVAEYYLNSYFEDIKAIRLRFLSNSDAFNVINQFNLSSDDLNNTNELIDEEVLTYYIKMYNYIYNEYRDEISETATLEDLLALDNKYFDYSFEDVTDNNATLATYMFSDISQINEKTYSAEPKAIGDYAYMVFKLSEPEKVDLKAEVMEVIKSAFKVPETATTSFELITEGPYESTITWVSSNPGVINKEGTVYVPEEDTLVSLSYTIEVLNIEETGTVVVEVPTTGDNSSVEDFDEKYDDLKTIINDDAVYNEIEDIILEDMVYGQNARTIINQYLREERKAMNFDIYDFFLSLDYRLNDDPEFDYEGSGHLTNLASIELGNGVVFNVTAEEFYQRGLSRNPSLMIFYAAQYEEAIQSDHFVTLFGEERNIDRNDSEYMGFLKNYITNIKNEYNNLVENPTYLDMYRQYYGWNFDTFQTYLYSRYRVENEKMLIEKLVLNELIMSFIKEALDGEDIVEKIYAVVEDNYENFFSLKSEQILIYFDFDEDSELDDYNEYYESLSPEDQTQFNTWLTQLKTLIKDSDDSFKDIVTEYKDAARDHEDWGTFKQKGFILKFESLNPTDDDNTVHSMSYSGEYGVKDQYIDEFTDALVALYNEYQNPVNADVEETISDLISTQFGLHLIKASKGSDFDGVSLEIEAHDYNNISDSLLNDNAKPSLAQIDEYYTYKIYEEYNDLENVSMVEKYGVTLPVIPNEVLEDLDIYAGETLEALFGNSTINYAFMLKILDGEVKSDLSQTEFETNIELLLEIYYDESIGSIELEE